MTTVTGVPNIDTLGGGQDFGPLSQQLSASWVVTSGFPSLNDIPGVTEFKALFENLAQILVQLLEVVSQILQAAKTFAVAYANPIQTLSKVLLEQIQVLIRDIRQIGLYLTSDADLFKEGWPLSGLRGGYAGYERRMIARLTDTTDPTRPVVSDQTYVLGMFFYLSADVTGVYQMITSMQQLLAMFSFSFGQPSQGLPGVSQPTVKYGFGQNNLVPSITTAFKGASSPLSIATLEWSLTPPAGSNPGVLPAPQGFIVEVCVPEADGLPLWASRPASTRGGAAVDTAGADAEPTEFLPVLDADGNQIVLYGGADQIAIKASTSISTAYGAFGDTLVPNARFFALAPPDKAESGFIPPDKLRSEDGVYYLQRTFKLSKSAIVSDPSLGVYRYSIALADLPHKARFDLQGGSFVVTDLGPSKNYIVRVSAVTDAVDQYDVDSVKFALRYDLTVPPAPDGDVVANLLGSAKPSAQRGPSSPPVGLSFPTKVAGDFFLSLRSALALLVLLRADLRVVDSSNTELDTLTKLRAQTLPVSGAFAQSVLPFSDGAGTDLEPFVDALFPNLASSNKVAFYRGSDTSPSAWSAGLSSRINLLAEDLYQRMGSLPAIEIYLAENTAELRTLTLGEIAEGKFDTGPSVRTDAFRMLDATILGSLNKRGRDGKPIQGFGEFGLASSPFQAFDLFNTGGLSELLSEGPYLIFQPPRLVLLEAIPVAEMEAANPGSPEALSRQMARLGWRKGTRADFGVGTSTELEYLKLQDYGPLRSKVPFQSEGYPVLYQYNPNGADPVTYAPYRALFDTPTGRKVMQQAALVLNVAASTLSTTQGQWYALRFGNTVLNGNLNELLTKFNNYVLATNNAFATTAQVLVDYIGFLQARIREQQRFIGLINFYIDQMDSFVIPQMAVLTVVAPGTEGVLSALVSADNKPADGPASYGAGAAVVVPLLAGSKFLLDLIAAWQKDQAQGE